MSLFHVYIFDKIIKFFIEKILRSIMRSSPSSFDNHSSSVSSPLIRIMVYIESSLGELL